MGVYEELGLRPAINASGKMTALGGSVLDDGVVAAMGEAARSHVVMEDLLRAAGQVIATATGAEDGCPTTGAASGVAIAVAAVVAGSDPARVEMLPDAGGRPDEVVLMKGHSVNFGAPVRQMIAIGGGRAIEVGSVNKVSPAHLEGAIGERTAALLFIQSHHTVHKGQVSRGDDRDRPAARYPGHRRRGGRGRSAPLAGHRRRSGGLQRGRPSAGRPPGSSAVPAR
ncbi:hypothetical protein NKH18_30210 [Streptomyces sp. M10(2022)]